jgi:hypothetical protein
MSTEGAELWREGHNRERDAQRQAQLQNALAGATTQEEKNAVIHDAYAKDPSALKQHIENLGRRLVGKQPQAAPSPYAAPSTTTATPEMPIGDSGVTLPAGAPVTVTGPAPRTRQEAFAGHAARGKTEAQQNLDAYKAKLDAQLGAQAQTQQGQVAAVRKIQADSTLSEDDKRQLLTLYGVPNYRPTTDEMKRQDFQAALMGGYKGSYEQWVAEQATKGRVAGTPAKPGTPRVGTSGGKNVYALLTDQGWVDAGTKQPLRDFRPLPNYAQIAPTMRAMGVVDPNDQNSVIASSIPDAIKNHSQLPQSIGYKTRAAVQKAFTTGTPAQNITSINTLRGHLSLLRKAAEGLQNGDTQLFNSWAQRYAQATGGAAPTDFESMKVAVASELARTLTGKGATVQEISQIEQPLSIADSPEQFNQAFDDFDGQMQSRLDALQQTFDAGMQGKPAFGGESKGPAPKKGGPKVGDKKRFPNGKTGVWDGQGWAAQ